MEETEIAYLTESELDEIAEMAEFKTIDDIFNYIKYMPERKKQIVMKLFFKLMAVRQWKTIAMEKY